MRMNSSSSASTFMDLSITEAQRPVIQGDNLESLASVVRGLHAQGLTPATSSNFSIREAGAFTGFSISVSGLDKGLFSAKDFMQVDASGKPLPSEKSKPSAETLLHRTVYRSYPSATSVLHTHSIAGVVLSKLYETAKGIELNNFEMLKAFKGIQSHAVKLWIPIFPNSQNMDELSEVIENHFQSTQAQGMICAPGFILAGHGLYAWGDTLSEAKRHIEAFEYLFTCLLALKNHGYTSLS